jgi:hypothetical protein
MIPNNDGRANNKFPTLFQRDDFWFGCFDQSVLILVFRHGVMRRVFSAKKTKVK